MNIIYALKPHSQENKNRLWKNNYEQGWLIQNIKLWKR